MILKDRHGRQFFAVIEKSSGFPTGLVQALFEVPYPELIPPQKYMSFPVDEPGVLVIDYVSWEADQLAREKEWDSERLRLINILPGGAANPVIAQELGPRPLSHKMVRAMRQGNRWALGFTAKRPPQADLYFPPPQTDAGDDVLTETEPVLAEETVAGAGGTTLAALLAEVKARCPSHLRGGARSTWIAAKLEEMSEQEA
jgi:hypothetical protein